MGTNMNGTRTVLIWVAALLAAGLFFYALDLWIMGAQGLPLNWDMTPAQ